MQTVGDAAAGSLLCLGTGGQRYYVSGFGFFSYPLSDTGCVDTSSVTDPCDSGCEDGDESDGTNAEQVSTKQGDSDHNFVGQPYQHVWGLENEEAGTGTGYEWTLPADPDQAVEYVDLDRDGLPAYEEFRWGTIPLLNSGVAQVSKEEADGLPNIFSKDTDVDGLHDGAEKVYWNDPRSTSTAWQASEMYHYDTSGSTVVRDPDSYKVDPDGDDPCADGGAIEYPFSVELGDGATIKGCSDVADDSDSDNDGIEDGREVSMKGNGTDPYAWVFEGGEGPDPDDYTDTSRGIGRWVEDPQGSPYHDYEWQGGAFAEFSDSECAAPKGTVEVNGSIREVHCFNRGNYWNNTEPVNKHLLYQLDPGTGDGIDDKAEYVWYTELEQTSEKRYNWENGTNVTAWTYHKARNSSSWDQEDARLRTLHAYEIDYDGDNILPLMEHHADADGLPDNQEGKFGNCAGSLPYVMDVDYDGISDRQECGTAGYDGNGTAADDWDTDGDGMPDGYEARHNLSPTSTAKPDGAQHDLDGDGISNLDEYCYEPPGDTGTLTSDDRPDEKYGCKYDDDGNLQEEWKYWDWNPCALEPNNNDTDGDGDTDGAEEGGTAETNAASRDETRTDACPASAKYEIKAIPGETLELDSTTNYDRASYNSTLEDQVTSSTHDASETVEATKILASEKMSRALSRSSTVLQERADSAYRTVNNTLPVKGTPVSHAWDYTSSTLSSGTDILTGDPTKPTRPVSRLLNTSRSASPMEAGELLKDAQETAQYSASNASEIASTLTSGDLRQSLVTKAERTINNPKTATKQTDLTSNLTNVTSTAKNPREVLDSENVVPDFTYSLLNSKPGGVNTWKIYQKLLRQDDGEDLLDSSHYKVLAVGPNASTQRNLTPNIKFGTEWYWNVDGDDTTGSDHSGLLEGCTSPHSELCIGDDVRVEVTVKETADGILEPTLEVTNWAPDEDFPWMIMAFALPHTRGESTLDPQGGERGYVAHLGLDGRPHANESLADAPGLDANRSYTIDDLPAWFNVSISNFGLATSSPTDCDVQDPYSYSTFRMSFEPQEETFSGRFDAQPAAGITEYRHTSNGKEIVDDGNSTRFSGILRGVPEDLRVKYSANATGLDCDAVADALTDLSNISKTLKIKTDVERGWEGTTNNSGAEFAIRRESNYSSIRPAKNTNLVTTNLTTGAYIKSVEEDPLGDARNETHILRGIPAKEIYASEKEWRDISEDTAPENITRAWISGAPSRLQAQVDTGAETAHISGSSPAETIRILEGATNGNCRNYEDEAANYVVLHGVKDPSLGCYAARIHALETLEAHWTDTANGLELDLTVDRAKRDATSDGLEILISGNRWLRTSMSDLPREVNVSFDHDQTATGGPGTLDMEYGLSPSSVSPDVQLRSKLPPVSSGAEEGLLELAVKDLPSHGEADLDFESREFNVSFPKRVSNLSVLYTETGTRPDLEGPHAAFLKRSDGKISASASVPGFRSIGLDATNSSKLLLNGDIQSNQEVDIAVSANTPLNNTHPNRMNGALSSLPGPFEIRAHRVNESAFQIQSDLASQIEYVTLDGVLRNRAYNLTLEHIKDVDLSYESWTTTSGRHFQFSGSNSRPVNLQGRIVDVGSGDNANTAYAAAPGWADDHLVRVVDEENGSKVLSFDVTGIESADITYHSRDSERRVNASYQFGSSGGSPRDFYLRNERKRDGENPLTYVEVEDLPDNVDITFGPGHLDYTASSSVPSVEANLTAPDDELSIGASIAGLPAEVHADWPEGQDTTPTTSFRHSGSGTIDEIFLRYQDRDDGPFLAANLTSVPPEVTVEGTPNQPQVNVTAKSGTSYEPVGLVDVRYNGSDTGTPPKAPSGCPTPDCHDSGVIAADLTGHSPTSAVVRVEGVEWLDGSFGASDTPGVDNPGSHLRYHKTASNPLFLDLETPNAVVRGNLRNLPKKGELLLDLQLNDTGVLQQAAMTWDGSSIIQSGGLFFDLDRGESQGRRLVFTEFRDLSDYEVTFEANKLEATSPNGIGYFDIQYASQDASEDGVMEEPNSEPDTLREQLENTLFGESAPNGSHYLYLDNRTKKGKTWELFQVRAWNLTNAVADPTNGTAALHLDSNTTRPAEIRVDRPKYNGTLNVSELPKDVAVTWNPHGGDETYSYDASSEIGTVHARFNATVENNGRSDRFLVDLEAQDLAKELHLVRKASDNAFRLNTGGTGALGELEGYIQNITGQRSSDPPLRLDAPGQQGVVLVDEYSGPALDNSSDLQEASFRIEGLRRVQADFTDNEATVHLDRADTGGAGAGLALARDRKYTEVFTRRLPSGDSTLDAEMTAVNRSGPDTKYRNRTASLDYQGDETLGDGYIYRSSPKPGTHNFRRVNVTYADLQNMTLTYNLVKRTQGDDVGGYERVAYHADQAGADARLVAEDLGTRVDVNLTGLPGDAVLNVTRDRSKGDLTTKASGAIGRIEALVRPKDVKEFRTLEDGVEGLLARNTSAETSGGRANITQVRVTKLQDASWDVSDNGLPSGSASFSLDHNDSSKPVTLATATYNESSKNTTITEVNISDLPDDWDLSLESSEGHIDLHYNASEKVGYVRAYWRRKDPDTVGFPYIEASVSELGAGQTSFAADINSNWDVTFDADNASAGVGVSTVRGDEYMSGTWTNLPSDLDAHASPKATEGVIETQSSSLGTIDVYRAQCQDENKNGNGVCQSEPSGLTMANFDGYDSVLYRAVNQSSFTGIPPNASFLHLEDLQKARWSVGAADSPDWNAFKYHRTSSTNATWGVFVRGYPGSAATNLTADLRSLPQDLSLMAHRGNATYDAPNATKVPDGFDLEGASLDPEDWFLDLDASGDFSPHVRFAKRPNATSSPEQLFNLWGVEGLDDTRVHYDVVDQRFWEGANLNTTLEHEIDRLGLTVQQKRTPETVPTYLNASFVGFPKDADVRFVKTPSVDCPFQPSCEATIGLNTHGGALDAVDAVYKRNSSDAGRMDGDGGNYLQILADQARPGADPNPNASYVRAKLKDVKTVMARMEDRDAHVRANLPTGSASDPLEFHYTRRDDDSTDTSSFEGFSSSVTNLNGELRLHWNRSDSLTDDSWSVSGRVANQRGDYSVSAEGDIEWEREDRNVTSYNLSATGVSKNFEVRFQEKDDGRKRVLIETGDTDTITGRFDMESHVQNTSTHGGEVDTDDGGEDAPLDVYVNTDPSDGSYTGGSVGYVNLLMGTLPFGRTGFPNHFGMIKSEGQGVDEVGKSLRLRNVERLEAHVVPKTGSKKYRLETQFESVDHRREFQLRRENGTDITKVWSNSWPDRAWFSAKKPEGVTLDARDVWVSAGGGGGEMHCMDSSTCGKHWRLKGQVPWEFEVYNKTFSIALDWNFHIGDGSYDNMTIPGFISEDIISHLPRTSQFVLHRAEGFLGQAVEAADIAASEVAATISSASKNLDFRTHFEVDRSSNRRCNFQYDLDGVKKWANQSVVHGHCTGYVRLDHSADGYDLGWEAGSPDDQGWINETSVQFKNDTNVENDKAYRPVTLDGTVNTTQPVLKFREGDYEYTVPDCIWNQDCS